MTTSSVFTYLNALFPRRYRSVRKVEFFGGEPTLCPDVIEATCMFFSKLVDSGEILGMPEFLMVSNGTLINETTAKLIAKYKIGVTISIDGPQDINDLLRINSKGVGSFSLIKHGINNMEKAGMPPVMIEATYTQLHKKHGYSKHDIKVFLENEFHVKDIIIADCNEGGDSSLVIKKTDSDLDDYEFSYNSMLSHTYSRLKRKAISPYGCSVGISSFAIIPNGDIYPCHFFLYYPEYRIAYFDGEDFDFSAYHEIQKKFEFINMHHRVECRSCWAKPVCATCSAIYLLENDIDLIKRECAIRKQIGKKMILDCVKICYAEKHNDL